MIRFRFLVSAALASGAIVLASLVTVSCAGSPRTAPAPEKTPPRASQRRAEQGRPAERPPAAGLADPTFRDLPEGVVPYLERIAEAVKRRDADFLSAQGERDYEKRVRGNFEGDAYLALLYRIGPYAADRPSSSPRPPRLEASRLRSIRYTGWDDLGPVVEIRGTLTMTDGKSLPCKLMVLWKLKDPRLLGEEP